MSSRAFCHGACTSPFCVAAALGRPVPARCRGLRPAAAAAFAGLLAKAGELAVELRQFFTKLADP